MTFVATPIADSARPAPPRVLVSQLQGELTYADNSPGLRAVLVFPVAA